VSKSQSVGSLYCSVKSAHTAGTAERTFEKGKEGVCACVCVRV
jgi:hypothetical protein